MNEAVFSMYALKCFELGIIPIRNFNGEPVNISEALDLATQDEARKMKRKFRKLWRKSRKTKCRGARSGRVHQTLYKAALLEFDK